MSWGVSVSSQKSDELFQAVEDAFNAQNPSPAPGVKDQYEAAAEALDGLFTVGVVHGELFNASLSGHAQQFDGDGKPLDAKDWVTVSLNAVG